MLYIFTPQIAVIVVVFFPECHGVLQGALWPDPGGQHEAVHPDGVHLADEQRTVAPSDGGPERDVPHHGGSGARARAAAQSAQRLRHGKSPAHA